MRLRSSQIQSALMFCLNLICLVNVCPVSAWFSIRCSNLKSTSMHYFPVPCVIGPSYTLICYHFYFRLILDCRSGTFAYTEGTTGFAVNFCAAPLKQTGLLWVTTYHCFLWLILRKCIIYLTYCDNICVYMARVFDHLAWSTSTGEGEHIFSFPTIISKVR